MPCWVPAGATNHFQRQIEAASINKPLQEVTFNVNDDYEQVTISAESSEVKVVIPEPGMVKDCNCKLRDEQNNESLLVKPFLIPKVKNI